MVLANMDPPRSIFIALQLNINVAWMPSLLIPRLYFDFYIYLIALRWLFFIGSHGLVAGFLTVKYLELITVYLNENHFFIGDLKQSILIRQPIELAVHFHRMTAITLYIWSYCVGKFNASLLFGAAFFSGLSDYFIVKHADILSYTTYFVILGCSLAVKIMHVMVIEIVSNINTKSDNLIHSIRSRTYHSKYLKRLLLAERSARMSVPCFYFNKHNKIFLCEIPVTDIGINFMLTF